jgi:hypothetical protein
MRRSFTSVLLILAAGFAVGLIASTAWNPVIPPATAHGEQPKTEQQAAPSIRDELEQIKGKLPGQAHAMMDVSYHFANLWFAVQRGNWPLAQFYFNETRSHLRWAIRIIPVRKDSQGQEIKLPEILAAVENSPLKQLESAIQAQDREKFVAAYDFTLTGCYSCHKAVDKPYLTLKVPDHPADAMIDFNPLASASSATAPQALDSSSK